MDSTHGLVGLTGKTKIYTTTALTSLIGVYTIVVTGSVIAGRTSNSYTYTYEITSICITDTFTAPTLPTSTSYKIGDPLL